MAYQSTLGKQGENDFLPPADPGARFTSPQQREMAREAAKRRDVNKARYEQQDNVRGFHDALSDVLRYALSIRRTRVTARLCLRLILTH